MIKYQLKIYDYHEKEIVVDFDFTFSGLLIKPNVAFHESIDRLKEVIEKIDFKQKGQSNMKIKVQFELPYDKADDFYNWLNTHPKYANVFIGRN